MKQNNKNIKLLIEIVTSKEYTEEEKKSIILSNKNIFDTECLLKFAIIYIISKQIISIFNNWVSGLARYSAALMWQTSQVQILADSYFKKGGKKNEKNKY